jgi:hypothetical protein
MRVKISTIERRGSKVHSDEFLRRVICAYGDKTARQIAIEEGVTRNTIIGIWDRAKNGSYDYAFT